MKGTLKSAVELARFPRKAMRHGVFRLFYPIRGPIALCVFPHRRIMLKRLPYPAQSEASQDQQAHVQVLFRFSILAAILAIRTGQSPCRTGNAQG